MSVGSGSATRARWANPDFVIHMRAMQKARFAPPEKREEVYARVNARWSGLRRPEPPVEVPKWVPEDLRERYLAHARRHGEQDAASHVRRIKAGRRA